MAARPNESAPVPPSSTTSLPPPPTTLSPREAMRANFYRTYDAMTGVRIAATLGGFFALMVLLVVYKSKSKTEKALEDPKLAAAAVAEVEEEERQLAAALEATAFQELNPRRARRSLDTSGAPSPAWARSTTRFSSVGGYSSLMEPPTRAHPRLTCFADEDSPPEEDRFSCEDFSVFYNRYLDVPRRSSNITCSSSDSSYLERRGSSVVLGLPAAPPPSTSRSRRRQSSPPPTRYPIDIRVIQPTPSGSPCGSERAIFENARLAPLASISSCNSSLAMDYADNMELQSFASDSVFRDEEGCDDTDDEVEPFSTDSEGPSEGESPTVERLPLSDRRSPSTLGLPGPGTWSQETLF